MPKTKLDYLSISPAETRARIVRAAADRLGLFHDRDLADILHMSNSCMSGRMSGTRPWRLEDLTTLAARIDMTDEEIIRFVRGR